MAWHVISVKSEGLSVHLANNSAAHVGHEPDRTAKPAGAVLPTSRNPLPRKASQPSDLQHPTVIPPPRPSTENIPERVFLPNKTRFSNVQEEVSEPLTLPSPVRFYITRLIAHRKFPHCFLLPSSQISSSSVRVRSRGATAPHQLSSYIFPSSPGGSSVCKSTLSVVWFCGGCHGYGGAQIPRRARQQDASGRVRRLPLQAPPPSPPQAVGLGLAAAQDGGRG